MALRVCSRSSWAPVKPMPRRRPTASISSRKMMHGELCLACGTGRGRAGPDADEHLDEVRAADAVERHVGLAGDGLGQQRLAGAGGPMNSTPARHAGSELVEPLGLLRNSMISRTSSLASTMPATSSKVMRVASGRMSLARVRPKLRMLRRRRPGATGG